MTPSFQEEANGTQTKSLIGTELEHVLSITGHGQRHLDDIGGWVFLAMKARDAMIMVVVADERGPLVGPGRALPPEGHVGNDIGEPDEFSHGRASGAFVVSLNFCCIFRYCCTTLLNFVDGILLKVSLKPIFLQFRNASISAAPSRISNVSATPNVTGNNIEKIGVSHSVATSGRKRNFPSMRPNNGRRC
jgi:hypothetical protein